MTENLPILLVPGLVCSPRIYEPQLPALWQKGPVIFPNHARDATMVGIAKRILSDAPPRFAVAGTLDGRLYRAGNIPAGA